MDPKELQSFMNEFYAAVFEPVRRRGGVVLDVKGDSMLAIWATGDSEAASRQEACLAALDIAAAVNEFNSSSRARKLPIRVALHSGQVMLGSIGAIDHYEYRAVGDIVNTVSRLDGLNKVLSTRVLASEEALQGINGFVRRELGRFLLPGKSRPILAYELLGREDESDEGKRELCAVFSEALDAYRRRSWEEAIGAFNRSIEVCGEDGPSMFYLESCRKYSESPPGEDWDGLIGLDEK
jgi:adenylate cyclase